MNIALIGAGKTGRHVKDLAGEENVTVYNSASPPTGEKLKKADVAVIFVPGDAAAGLIEPLLEAGIPAVWGTTGYKWPEDLPDRVKVSNARWVMGSNFSLGMNLMRRCLDVIGRGSAFLKDPAYLIHEVHHTDKQDAPSGTALKWKEWLAKDDARISSSRTGDVKGIHSLHVKTDFESLHLKHEAHDRAVFAHGALWCAHYILDNASIMPGVYTFESIIDLAFSQSQ
ncbi:MAG: dihydrodipicolinate reductase C-terminal domain-containing protein [Balneolaceae bacterium]